jgi:hypothetical protein
MVDGGLTRTDSNGHRSATPSSGPTLRWEGASSTHCYTYTLARLIKRASARDKRVDDARHRKGGQAHRDHNKTRHRTPIALQVAQRRVICGVEQNGRDEESECKLRVEVQPDVDLLTSFMSMWCWRAS